MANHYGEVKAQASTERPPPSIVYARGHSHRLTSECDTGFPLSTIAGQNPPGVLMGHLEKRWLFARVDDPTMSTVI
jgi:hypothetical protein